MVFDDIRFPSLTEGAEPFFSIRLKNAIFVLLGVQWRGGVTRCSSGDGTNDQTAAADTKHNRLLQWTAREQFHTRKETVFGLCLRMDLFLFYGNVLPTA